MPAVFVHGVPESAAVWDALFAQLTRRDVVALSPPGFGSPVPEGFAATADAYLAWLTTKLGRIGGPIDLVGHDWGGGHVIRLVMSRPDLIRSWVIDIGGALAPGYVWHDLARTWQTPVAGEAALALMVNAPRAMRTAQLESLGLGPAAPAVAAAMNSDMARCILALYRSAVQPQMSTWGEDLPKAAVRPGLVVIPTDDSYTGGEVLARRSAERAGARAVVLHGRGHWWMCEDPGQAARVLDEFFASVQPTPAV
jgi:pimeloyl-ACP methyl ester carboxylesterase